MYVPRGFGYSEVGDIEVFPLGDELHLFHLTLPNHDAVQHAVSSDGLAWRELPVALRTGDPGACDDDQIWTMSVTAHDGAYFMIYTALAKAEDGQVQRTAVARSTDLVHWEKSPANPVGEADPRWYEATVADSGRVSWRDPKPILVDGIYYATVNAREKDGPLLRRGCVGLLATTDLVHWEVRPPLFAPHRYWDIECPQVFTLGGRYYLTAAIMEDRTQRYWVADSFAGPYLVPPDGGILAPQGHYAGRVCTWRGETLYVCWHRPGAQDGPVAVDWTTMRNPVGKFVVAPLTLTPRDDGSLARTTFRGWRSLESAPPAMPSPATHTVLRRAPVADTREWTLTSPPGDMDLLATAADAQDFRWTGSITLDAVTGGLACRLDPGTSGGYFIELRTDSRELLLKKWLPATDPRTGQPWFTMDVLQRGELLRPLVSGVAVPFTLTSSGPYLELELGGQVVLATLSQAVISGRLGCWVESGVVRIDEPRVAPLRPIVHG